MKKIALALLAIGLYGSCNTSDQCSNEKLDGNETEIDCGGDCNPCPTLATVNATLEGVPYVASSAHGTTTGSGIHVFSSGTAGAQIEFSFSGRNLNTSLPVQSAVYRIPSQGDRTFAFGDTGSVHLTYHDEIRKIISGRFFVRLTGNPDITGEIDDCVFENVRY